jgi:hypothetical protein
VGRIKLLSHRRVNPAQRTPSRLGTSHRCPPEHSFCSHREANPKSKDPTIVSYVKPYPDERIQCELRLMCLFASE